MGGDEGVVGKLGVLSVDAVDLIALSGTESLIRI
jgi:hypothetical protein